MIRECRIRNMDFRRYRRQIAAVIPWTTILILATVVAIEALANGTGDREEFCNILALSPDRWYTTFTYWTIHTDPEHAWKNIGQWALTATFMEWKLRTKWLTATCAVTTLAVGLIVQVAIGAELTNGDTGKGLSIIGWMVIVPVAAILINCFTGSARKLSAGVVLTFLVLGLGAALIAEEPWTLPVGMLGHIGGAVAGFLVFAVAVRAGKYEFTPKSWEKEFIVIVALVMLAVFALMEVTALSSLDI